MTQTRQTLPPPPPNRRGPSFADAGGSKRAKRVHDLEVAAASVTGIAWLMLFGCAIAAIVAAVHTDADGKHPYVAYAAMGYTGVLVVFVMMQLAAAAALCAVERTNTSI